VTDALGNIYVCGRITDSCDFNGLIPDTIIGGDDVFLAKFDCEGHPVWVRIAGNPSDGDIASSLTLDNSGHIYITGSLEGDFGARPITFIDTTYYENTADMFIAKFDTSGTFDWVKIVGPGNIQIGSDGYKVVIDSHDRPNVLVTADQPGIFLPGDSIYGRGIYVARFDTSGNLERLIKLGVWGQVTFYRDMKIDQNDNYYITGSFGDDSLSLGGQTIQRINPMLGFDLFLYKLDSSGIAQWNFQLGCSVNNSYSNGYGIAFDVNQNIILTGGAVNGNIIGSDTLYNTLDTLVGNDFPFVAKFTPQGVPIWATHTNCMYGSRSEGGVVVKSNGNIMISGFFGGPATMGPDSMNSDGLTDIFLAEISPSGNVLHGYQLDCNDDLEKALCMTRDWNDNIFVGGAFGGTLYYNGGSILSAGGYTDGFIAKWGNSLCTVGIENPSATGNGKVSIFPNPVHKELNVSWNSTALETHFILYDIFGKCIYRENIKTPYGQNTITLVIPDLSAGMYFLSVGENGISETVKCIKN
jgi:hypothetical protein